MILTGIKKFITFNFPILCIGGFLPLYIAVAIFESGPAHYIFHGMAFFLWVFLGLYFFISDDFKKENNSGHNALIIYTMVFTLLAYVFYFIQSDFSWEKISSLSADKNFTGKIRTILQILLFCAFMTAMVFAVIAKSIVNSSYGVANRAQNLIFTVSALLLFCFAINYISYQRPLTADLTLWRRFSLSEEGKKIVKSVDKKVQITAFYPYFHDYHREVELLLRDIRANNYKIEYTFADTMREKEISEAKKVTEYGWVVFECIDETEHDINLRTKTRKVNVMQNDDLKRMEKDFISAILGVTEKKRTVFFTAGHDEKYIQGPFTDDLISVFEDNLRYTNYQIEQLTPDKGFPGKIPEADVIISIGARRDFTKAEKESLGNFIEKGGRMFIATDPDSRADFSFLLNSMGLEYKKEYIHSDFSLKPRKKDIVAINYTDHSIVQNLVNLPEHRKYSVFPGSGFIHQKKEDKENFTVDFIVSSHYTSWLDTIPDGKRNDPKEKPGSFKLAAALKSNKSGGRIVFFSDSDFVTNKYIEYSQNKRIAIQSVQWLAENERVLGLVPAKWDNERVKLPGYRDAFVKYFLIFIWPGIILISGLTYVKKRKQKMLKKGE